MTPPVPPQTSQLAAQALVEEGLWGAGRAGVCSLPDAGSVALP